VISWPGLLLVLADLAIVVAILVSALRRRYDDSDKGVGNRVILPSPRLPSRVRDVAFVVLVVCGSIFLIAIRQPDLQTVYRSILAHLTEIVIDRPAVVSTYVAHIRPVIPISVIAFSVAAAVTMPETVPRGLAILFHAPLALAAALLADTVLAVFTISTGLPLGPAPIVSIALHYLVAYVVGMRLGLTTFQLPRPTQVPIRREKNTADDLIVLVVLATVVVLLATGAAFVLHFNPQSPVLYAFVIIAIPAYLNFGLYSVLSLLRLFGPPNPEPDDRRPPVDVVAPAYNESANITAWVEALDAAATVYGGPVRAFLCDDGSTDGTGDLARAAFARAVSIEGHVLSGSHAGKSTALNLALSHCTADIVVRHDSDCVVHPNVFRYTVPWFLRDERIGLVGAFMLPKFPFTTWIDRMRSLELAAGFGLPRLAYAVVDSQPCVPGNYTAFRREAALEIGGWPEGMFGEDIDFTCELARLGYRAAYDRRVWAYEDVPNTVGQLLAQRRRWNRGSIYNFARFIPPACGSSGPRFWFAEFFRAARRLVMPVQFAAYLFVIQAAFFRTGPRENLFHLAIFYVLAKLPMLIIVMCSMFYRGLWRSFLWWPLYLGFAFVKRMANLEALLTMRTRPVHLPLYRRKKAVVDEAISWPVLPPRYLVADQ
jgi:cellulose synthase/poly-beta-1,6-N-acetylglucosamine synthase-like glycosyltransferase